MGKGLLNDLDDRTSSFSPQFAVTKWDGATQQIFMTLQSNGTVKAFYQDGTTSETLFNVTFEGWDEDPNPKWDAIAMDLTGSFYGKSNGKVLEYRMDESDISKFSYSANVY